MGPIRTPPPGFDELSVDEQIDYLQALWDRIAADPGRVPVPQWHVEELRRREGKPSQDRSVPWEEVRERIMARRKPGS